MAPTLPWLAGGAVAGVVLGIALAPRLGLRRAEALRSLLFAGLWALLGGHLGALFLYHPGALDREGWSVLLDLDNGLAAMGMLVAGGFGAWLHARLAGAPAGPRLDLAAAAAAPAGLLGRVGCALAGDHPGSGSLDPALAEAVIWTAVLVVLLRSLRRQPRTGTRAALAALLYGDGRFFADLLRLTPEQAAARVASGELDPALVDPRWAGLTPGQWLGLALALGGLLCLLRLRVRAPSGGPAGQT